MIVMVDTTIKALVREAWLAHNHPFQPDAPVMGPLQFRMLETHPEFWRLYPNGVNIMRGYEDFVRHIARPTAPIET